MENPASKGEETNTEEGETATPPGNEISHVPNPQFHYPGPMVPYVEGPKMDQTIDNALHSRSVQWKIKCENILDCELSILQESAKCKKVIQWHRDVGLHMYISWALAAADVKSQTIWTKFKEFWKPQSNVIHARFDLLTSFRQGNRRIDKWYNAVQAHIPLCEYSTETAMILIRDIFWFFMSDTDFIAKTINDENTELAWYPAAKV